MPRIIKFTKIDDYAKDGGAGAVWLLVVFTMILCSLKLQETLITLLSELVWPGFQIQDKASWS